MIKKKITVEIEICDERYCSLCKYLHSEKEWDMWFHHCNLFQEDINSELERLDICKGESND